MNGERPDIIIIDDIEDRVTGANVAAECAKRGGIILLAARTPRKSTLAQVMQKTKTGEVHRVLKISKYVQTYRDL